MLDLGESIIFGHKFTSIDLENPKNLKTSAIKLDLFTNIVMRDDSQEDESGETTAATTTNQVFIEEINTI